MYVIYYDLISIWYLDYWNIHIISQFHESFVIMLTSLCDRWVSNSERVSPQSHHMSPMDLVVSPPGCGRSVTYFLDWDAHEAQLHCPDEVGGDIWIWSTRSGLKPKFY
jgi:hypothetical protein